jgi:hypothetical protein
MTNNKQQTAVDFAVEKLSAFIQGNDLAISLIKHQSKEMEKERIETAYNKGTVHGIDYPESTLPITGEQYSKQTYGGGNK